MKQFWGTSDNVCNVPIFRIEKDTYLWVKFSNFYNLDRHDIEKKINKNFFDFLFTFLIFYEAKASNKAFSK